MEVKRVGDIMIPLDEYPHLPHWFTLRQALAEMEGAQFEVGGIKSIPRAVLVFDEAYRLLGLARRRDIMRGIEPRFLKSEQVPHRTQPFAVKADPELSELSFDHLLKAIREQAERPVSEVMQPIKATLDVGDHIMKAVSEFVEHDLCLVPVLEGGKVAGVVNTVGVCHELAKMVL
jgi:CBS-domain-containing membrane protein